MRNTMDDQELADLTSPKCMRIRALKKARETLGHLLVIAKRNERPALLMLKTLKAQNRIIQELHQARGEL